MVLGRTKISYRLLQDNTIHVFGVPVYIGAKDKLEDSIYNLLQSNKSTFIACLNPHSYVLYEIYPDYKASIHRAAYCICDGIGFQLVCMLRVAAKYRVPRITGRDLYRAACNVSLEKSVPIAIVGPDDQSAKDIATSLSAKGLTISATYVPPYQFRIDATAFSNSLCSSVIKGPVIIFVFIGAPKQEILAAEITALVPNCIVIPVGGIYEELSPGFLGRHRNSLKLPASKFGLEWLIRFLQNPARMWKRLFISSFIFGALVIRSALTLPAKKLIRYMYKS